MSQQSFKMKYWCGMFHLSVPIFVYLLGINLTVAYYCDSFQDKLQQWLYKSRELLNEEISKQSGKFDFGNGISSACLSLNDPTRVSQAVHFC